MCLSQVLLNAPSLIIRALYRVRFKLWHGLHKLNLHDTSCKVDIHS